MNVTNDATHWCDLCRQYIGLDRPAATYYVNGGFLRICIVCLRRGVEACEREAGDRIVRGQRE